MTQSTNDLPVGTVTFLFTDIEGSTRLLERIGRDPFIRIIERHNEILGLQISAGDGVLVNTEGDAVFAVFTSAADGVAAAAGAQQRLVSEPWPDGVVVPVRMGLHTGTGLLGGGDYVGIDVHRAARIAAAANGGQTLVSEATAVLVERSLPAGCGLRDLGKHRLKDLSEEEGLFQLDIPGLPTQFPPLRTLNAVPNNLPLQVTSFVGRENEVETAIRLLGTSRLLTLTGPGGTGKTRLALQVAAEVADQFADGAYFVSLSPVSDPELVPSSILSALGLSASTKDQTPRDKLLAQIAERNVLLVLDNFEHVLQAASIVSDVVRMSARTKVVVTSRSPLHLSGEQEMPVPPLDVVTPGLHDIDELLGIDAVHLFVERAASVRPDFSLTPDNAEAVAALVGRLDGLPLAIELVASRVKLLSPAAILGRFDAKTLAHSALDLPERQQTLWNAIGWSHGLLDEPLRRLFARMSVFRGGARLEEIEEVCGPAAELGIDVLDGLAALVDHSLVTRADRGGFVRFRMLEVIREFAAECLIDGGSAEELHRRHALAYVALAETSVPHVFRHDRKHWFDLLEADHDNLRAAMDWAVHGGEVDAALRMGWAAWRFWQARGHLFEARRRVEESLALPDGDPALRAKAVEACGGVAWWQGDLEASHRSYVTALEMQRALGNPREIANALYNYALTVGFVLNQRRESMALLEEAEAIYSELGDVEGLADVSWGKGNAALYVEPEEDTGRHHMLRSLELYEQAGNEFGAGWAHFEYGESARRSGMYEEAREHLLRGLRIFHSQDDLSGTVFFLTALAGLAMSMGDEERALRLAGAAQGLRIKTGADLINIEQNLVEGLGPAQLEALTGERGRLYQEGKAMRHDAAVAYALDAAEPRSDEER